MQDLPHHYRVAANGAPDGDVRLSAEKLETLALAPPQEFGGPGDRWSPETLLMAAVADCLIRSFRAIVRASKLSWLSLNCGVEGTFDRVEGTMKFTEFKVNATPNVPADTNEQRARRKLEEAEASCLITNFLSGATLLHVVVLVKSWS
jgi:organic hydroperoxide reductase OsmC/OhrA